MKKCSKCGEEKPLSEFHKDSNKRDGLQCSCKACHKAYYQDTIETRHAHEKEYRHKNKHKKKAYYLENRLAFAAYYQEHKEEIKAVRKLRYEEATRANRERHFVKQYGITISDYENMLASQNGVCLICGGINKNGTRLAVDHCHTTGKIRGLLCISCNRAIGLIHDNELTALKIYKYLAPMGGLEQLFELKQMTMELG